MPENGFTPITGVEGDPIDSGIIDEVNQQSVDPLLQDPQAQSEPVENDPAALNQLDELRDIGKRARQITDNPIPLLVAQIHEEIQQILRLQRDICDGVELAADQVQDKRIDFLEAGPEVTVGTVFIEVALIFFLESPLIGLAVKKALQQGYRFARAAAVARGSANRARGITRLRAAAEKFRAGPRRPGPEQSARFLELQQMELEARLQLHRSQSPQRTALVQKRLTTIQQLMGDLVEKSIDDAAAAAGKVAHQPPIEAKHLQSYFAELDEMAVQYGVGTVKGGIAGVRKGASAKSATTASDSVSVQLKSLSQVHLRNLELDLSLAAADADMLRSVAQADPLLAPDCIALLSEMLGVLQRDESQDNKPAETVDARNSVMIEAEKLIWAMLLPDETLNRPAQIEQLQKEAEEQPLQDPFLDSVGLALAGVAPFIGQPSPRLMSYLNARFFAEESLSTDDMLKRLKALKEDFLSKTPDQKPVDIRSIRFRQDAQTAAQGQSVQPSANP